ncbi:hypothetical protein MMC13_001134 [Lambiella insularis]|nr:hypothetical protein [Lambiella insularis]
MAESEQAYFESIPWCARILNDYDFITVPTPSRTFKASTEDALFAETLKTHDTIRACLTLYKRPPTGKIYTGEIRTLLHLGPGLNGIPNICHGGIQATVLDEVMGFLMIVNKTLDTSVSGGGATANLNVSYLKPVTTPQTVLVIAKIREVKGRKYYVDGWIENADGMKLTKAEGLFLNFGGVLAKVAYAKI